jgi:transcriptional regulator with XRE-family HTH domain
VWLQIGERVQILKLREARELQGLTQKELADVSGVSLRSIAGYESGSHVRPNTARKLANALGLEVADLVDDVVIFEAPYSSANFDEILDEAKEVIRGAKSLHVPEGMDHLALLIDNDKVEVRAKPTASAQRARRPTRLSAWTQSGQDIG